MIYYSYYYVHNELRRAKVLPIGWLLFLRAKDAAKYGRFYGVEHKLKKVYVHRTRLDAVGLSQVLLMSSYLGLDCRVIRRDIYKDLPGPVDLSYPKMLKVQERHISDYVQAKMLHSKEPGKDGPRCLQVEIKF